MIEKTCAIIKPDAVAAHHVGNIISMIEDKGFAIHGMQQIHLTPERVREFYAVHHAQPWFDELVEFMSSGPVVVLALEKEDGVAQWRELMGATNPQDAAAGTIRKLYAIDVGKNAVHGSDSTDSAVQELKFFFPDLG